MKDENMGIVAVYMTAVVIAVLFGLLWFLILGALALIASWIIFVFNQGRDGKDVEGTDREDVEE